MLWTLILVPILAVAVWDRIQTREPVLRIYPILGRLIRAVRHLRTVLYSESHSDGPFTVRQLQEIRQRGLTGSNIVSFGRSLPGGPAIDVCVFPSATSLPSTIELGGSLSRKRIQIPLLNFGALGFGPVNENVIRAFGLAAAEVDCLINTGEDGITSIHDESAARLVWQLGTGYWGCRAKDGTFSLGEFKSTLARHSVACIEVKLSQAAKPGAGGLLPARKVSRRVARLLGVAPHADVHSPSAHSAFSNALELLTFLRLLADNADCPVGVKLCIGSESSLRPLIDAMKTTACVPDFMTVDGAEGGSGAAPAALLGRCGLPVRDGVALLDRILRDAGLRERVRILGAGAIKDGFDLFHVLAHGADGCFFTRAPMVAMGCVQALECHDGTCPAGIASHRVWRRSAISPRSQGGQLVSYYRTVMEDVRQLARASGISTPSDLGKTFL